MGTAPQGEASLEAVVARLMERLSEVEQHEQEHQGKVVELEAANAALREEVATLRNAQAAAHAPRGVGGRTKREGARRTSRRTLLQLGGAAAAATVAAGVLAAERGGTARAGAARADGATITYTASGGGNWAIEGDGTGGADGIHGNSDSSAGVSGSGGIVGVSGSSIISGGAGVVGFAPHGVGGVFNGGLAALTLAASGHAGPPTGSDFHSAGEVSVDSSATLWVCVAQGTPGSWVRLTSVASGASGGATTFLSTPIRLLDTRAGFPAATTPGAPISAGSTFHLLVAGVSYNPGSGTITIPSTAKALVGNCTVVNPAGVGDLAVYPDLLPLPNTAVMHYLPGQIVSNGITIGLGTNGKLAITALSAATDVIVDCQGIIL